MEKSRFLKDGLNSLKYHIEKIEPKNTFTEIFVELIPEEVSRVLYLHQLYFNKLTK